MGIASPSLTSTVANAVPESALGVIGAAQQLLTQMGGVIGTQVMVTVVGGDGRRSDAGYRLAFSLAAAVAVLAIVSALVIRRTPRSAVQPMAH
jgi:MFS family permease